MVQLGLNYVFGRKILERDKTVITIKGTVSLIGKPDKNKRDVQELVFQTEEPDSTIEATEIVDKILDHIYTKADIDKVDADKFQLYKINKKIY